jgi:chromosome segregation ATPase
MRLLGQIFTVATALLSFCFLTLAVAVYSSHKDYRTRYEAAQKTLNEANSQFATLQEQHNRLKEQASAEAEAQLQQIRKLESERVRLVERNSTTQEQLDELRERERESIAAVNATQQNNDRLASEVVTLRGEIRENQSAKDRFWDTALEATENLQSLRNDLETAVERNRDLVADTGRMATLLESNGLNPDTPADDVTPRVDGFVSRTQRKGGVQLVEISIGSDDGLRPGQTVEVFYETKYKGRVEILKTGPDRAVGRVDVRYQQGPIQEGDRVATRLKLD